MSEGGREGGRGGGGGSDNGIANMSLSKNANEMHLIGWQNTWEQAPGVPATLPRPDGGRNPWPCTCVHGPKKVIPSIHEQHLWSCTACTSTLALQLELEVVVVVGANSVVAADPVIDNADAPKVSWYWKQKRVYFPSSATQPKVVVVVWTNTSMLLNQLFSMQTHPTTSWYWK